MIMLPEGIYNLAGVVLHYHLFVGSLSANISVLFTQRNIYNWEEPEKCVVLFEKCKLNCIVQPEINNQ